MHSQLVQNRSRAVCDNQVASWKAGEALGVQRFQLQQQAVEEAVDVDEPDERLLVLIVLNKLGRHVHELRERAQPACQGWNAVRVGLLQSGLGTTHREELRRRHPVQR